jgi:hypothetical protein
MDCHVNEFGHLSFGKTRGNSIEPTMKSFGIASTMTRDFTMDTRRIGSAIADDEMGFDRLAGATVDRQYILRAS